MADQAGGQMPQFVAQGVRFGVREAVRIVQSQQPGPGFEITGEIRGEHPATVDRPGLRREIVQATGLVAADPVFHHRVRAVQNIKPLRMLRTRDAPHVADVGGSDGVAPAGSGLEGGEVLCLPAGGSDPAHDQPHAVRPALPGVQRGQFRDRVAVLDAAVLVQGGFPV
jgi:hypothetical protein